jgi:hypothetical protein
MKEWVDAVVTAAGGKIVEEGEEIIKAVAEGDAAAEKFPLKMRDAAQVGGQQPWTAPLSLLSLSLPAADCPGGRTLLLATPACLSWLLSLPVCNALWRLQTCPLLIVSQ